jgi:hypothetical protein
MKADNKKTLLIKNISNLITCNDEDKEYKMLSFIQKMV